MSDGPLYIEIIEAIRKELKEESGIYLDTEQIDAHWNTLCKVPFDEIPIQLNEVGTLGKIIFNIRLRYGI